MCNNNNNNNNNNNRLEQSGIRIQAGKILSLLIEIHTGSGAHSAYCSMLLIVSFPRGKAARS